jgi:hypothetical protein
VEQQAAQNHHCGRKAVMSPYSREHDFRKTPQSQEFLQFM